MARKRTMNYREMRADFDEDEERREDEEGDEEDDDEEEEEEGEPAEPGAEPEEGEEAEGWTRRGTPQAQVPRGHDHLPLGVLAQATAGQGKLPAFHQVDQQGERCLQVGRLQGRLQALGPSQEQARHELRDNGPSSQVKKNNST